MTVKICIFFKNGDDLDSKIVGNIKDLYEFLKKDEFWPALAMISFDKPLPSEVNFDWSKAPKMPFCSKEFKNINPPDHWRIDSSHRFKFGPIAAYPLLGVDGVELLSETDLSLLPIEEKLSDEEDLVFNPELLRKLSDIKFSVRTKNCLLNSNIIYIGDLIQWSAADLLATPNFGRKSLNEINHKLSKMGLHLGMVVEDWPPENIEELVERIEKIFYPDELSTSDESNFSSVNQSNENQSKNIIDNFINAVSKIKERPRDIIFKRAGYNIANPKTLEEIGKEEDVTRERIRQLEAKGIKELAYPQFGWNIRNKWDDFFAKLFLEVSLPITFDYLEVYSDQMRGVTNNISVLKYIIDKALGKRLYVFEFNGIQYLSRVNSDVIEKQIAEFKNILPEKENSTIGAIYQVAEVIFNKEVSEFISTIVDECLIHSIIINNKLAFYAPRKSGLTVAYHILKTADRPLSNSEIDERIENEFEGFEIRNVRNRLPDLPGVFPFSSRKWGMIDHLNINVDKQLEIQKLIDQFITMKDHSDQVHSREIFDYLVNEDSSLEDILDEFKTAGFLRSFYSHEYEYMGRSMFSHKTRSDTSRLTLHDVAVKVLKNSGSLMKQKDLLIEINKHRSVSSNYAPHAKPPLKNFGGGLWGLEGWKKSEHQPSEMPSNTNSNSSSSARETPSNTPWTNERVELLKKLWDEGESASFISEQLGGVTRNAVLGKVHKLGLKIGSKGRLNQNSINESAVVAKSPIKEIPNNEKWTDKRIELLKKMYRRGDAISDIAKELTRMNVNEAISSNAIFNKIYTEKLNEYNEERNENIRLASKRKPWSFFSR